MLLELIAAVVAGFALSGIGLLLRFFLKDRIPRWIVPVMAGLGMISFAIWNEYDWVKRAEATLPDGVAIAWANEERALWRPWTYLAPITTRFAAVDFRNARRHPDMPETVLVRVVMMGRFIPGAEIPVAFDCAGNRRAELIDQRIAFGEDGQITGASWYDVPADDPLLRTACDGG